MSTDLHEYCFTYEFVFDVRYILFYSMLVHVTCISTCYEGKVENEKRTLRVGVVLDIPRSHCIYDKFKLRRED